SIAEARVSALLESALLLSPFVARARLQVDVAEADVRLARAAASPEVFIRAESQRGSFEANDDSTRNRLVLGVTSTLGAGLSSLSVIEEARARAEAAREDVRVQELAVTEQIRGDAVLLQSARVRQASLEQSRQSAADVLASSERLFIAGRRPWQDIMNAARDLAQTDSQIADAAGTELAAGWRLALLVHGVDAVLAGHTSQPSRHSGGG
ncbi:MAG: TolC family protein, partial [Gammaproteobacteria bacterium]